MTDEHFENYLREFAPRKPRAVPVELLERKTNQRFDGWTRLLAAAAVLLICGTSLWTGLRQKPAVRSAKSGNSQNSMVVRARKKTTFELTKVALDDSTTFETALQQEAQKTFPKFEEPDSTLRALTKE